MSDRVAVNHCVVHNLQSALDIELLELKCNVHPLDGIAKKCNTSFKLYDTEHNIESSTFGRECCAVNFIYAMCKMQGKGDPAGFKQFMRQAKIKPGIIVRYVGNWFHFVFHLAGVFYYLREKLLNYLDSACRNTTSLRSASQKDLRNNKLLLQLQTLGIIGKLITGPWMQQLYANQKITNLDSIPYVKTCLQNLHRLKNCPQLVFDTKNDVFDISLDEDSDEVLHCLQNDVLSVSEKECLAEILLRLITGVVDVIEHQMKG